MVINYYSVRLFCSLIFIVLFSYMCLSTYRYVFISTDISVIEKALERPSKSSMIHLNGAIKTLGGIKQTYVINLPYREDRRTGIIALFQKLDYNVFIVPGFDIHSPVTVSRAQLTRKGDLRLVELASWLSHIQVWLEIDALENDSWGLIFEDDIDLELSTFDILQSFPSDLWNIPDMIYLGYCGNNPGPIIYEGIEGYRVHQAMHPSCAHAYAIRHRSVEKILPLLSPPQDVIDDAIVELVKNKKILVYSIHPPLAIQQTITSSRPSDMNPVESTLRYKVGKGINYISEWWRGVEFTDKLKNSSLAQADFKKANEWRINHESDIWKKKHL